MRVNCWRPRGALRDAGELPTGRKVTGRADFFLGGADNPIDPPPGWEPKGLQAKIDAGAQFVQTQFCMDAGLVRRYMARLAEHGIADKLSVLIGIVPLRSAKSARWIKDKLYGAIIPDAIVARMEQAADPAAEGRRICVDLIGELADIPQVSPAATSWRRTMTRPCPTVIGAARESVKRLANPLKQCRRRRRPPRSKRRGQARPAATTHFPSFCALPGTLRRGNSPQPQECCIAPRSPGKRAAANGSREETTPCA